jgi:hypothetical protein
MMMRFSTFALLLLAFPATAFPISRNEIAGRSSELLTGASIFAPPPTGDAARSPFMAPRGTTLQSRVAAVSILITYALKQVKMNTGDKLHVSTYSFPSDLIFHTFSCAV